MYKVLLLAGLLGLSVGEVFSQTAVDSVKISIGNLFTAMKNSDSAAVMNCFADSAIMQTIARDKTGGTIIKNEKIADFVKIVGSMPKNAADEQIVFDVVKADGPLAFAWTPYKFYFNGQFSHCGVNSFQMIRQKGKWKIQYLIDTRRKQGCN